MSIEELQRKLRSMSKDILPVIEKAMMNAAQNVEGKAKENCPVITNRLRGSITSKVEQKGNEVIGIVGTNVEYAAAVHEGTSRRSPKPFILDAIAEKENETIEILSEGVEKAIKEHTK